MENAPQSPLELLISPFLSLLTKLLLALVLLFILSIPLAGMRLVVAHSGQICSLAVLTSFPFQGCQLGTGAAHPPRGLCAVLKGNLRRKTFPHIPNLCQRVKGKEGKVINVPRRFLLKINPHQALDVQASLLPSLPC